ncbi:MAG: anthranilate phosphoribosyltransferase [Bacteroidetes bacterium]|nr:anthranilate phosphoribosyltransferase [Bacteroidota bacterium]
MNQIFEKLLDKEDLTLSQSSDLMEEIMLGNVNNSLLAGILTSMRLKGVTSEELAGFAKVMKERCLEFNLNGNDAIDVCGTGGDNSGTFNISTAVAFVVAGTGIKVAKHGNRSISSKSGSADVLKELGVNITLPKEISEKALDEIGITFLFAPQYHPAMKNAAQVRKELAIRTIFNMLGPLTNPAGVIKQMIGTFSNDAAKLMAQASIHLNFERVCFLCCDNKYDEILLNGTTEIFEYNRNSTIKNYQITNETFGYDNVDISELKGDTAETNANIIKDIFNGTSTNGCFTTVTANAALALYCAKYSDNITQCKEAAEKSVTTGSAKNKLDELIKFCSTNR